MIVGFTGSRHGMTAAQRPKVFKWLMANASKIAEAHHGDCIGADEAFHAICLNLMIPQIYVHPPTDESKRAHCNGGARAHTKVIILPPKPFLVRDDDIAEVCTTLLATPAQPMMVQRSGTWTTIRYAQKKHKDIIILHPETGYYMKLR